MKFYTVECIKTSEIYSIFQQLFLFILAMQNTKGPETQEYGTEVQKIKWSYKPGLSCLLITCPLGHGASSTWCCLFRNSVLHSWRISYLPFKIFPTYLKKIKEHLSLVAVGTWNNIYSPPTDSQLSNMALEEKCLSIRIPSYWLQPSQGTATVYSYVIICLHFEISSSYQKASEFNQWNYQILKIHSAWSILIIQNDIQ